MSGKGFEPSTHSVGKDNISKAPVQSNIAGYYNVLQLGSRPGTPYNPHLWSRFWLVPDRVVLSVSPDGRSLAFGDTKIRVKTETMRMVGGRLSPAGGEKDAAAEYFAQHFTDHYQEFAKENPVYGELKRLAQIAAVAKWMKQAGIPIDFHWIEAVSSEPYETPETTPSISNGESHTWKTGTVTHTATQCIFGGTELAVPVVFRANSQNVAALQLAVLSSMTATTHPEAFEVTFGGKKLQAISVPLTQQPGYGSFVTSQTDIAATSDSSTLMLTRRYTSFHNAPTEFGRSWTMNLPRLYFESKSAKGQTNFIGIAGDSSARIQDQSFQLSDTLGLISARFTEHFIDQQWRRVGFRGPATSRAYRGLYPNKDGSYSVISANGDQMRFDREGRLIESVKRRIVTRYVFDKHDGHVIELSSQSDTTRASHIQFHHDSQGRIDMAQTDAGQRVQYTYDENGDLMSATAAGHSVAYLYDDAHLLSAISADGTKVVQNEYGSAGNLTRQLNGRGEILSEHRVEKLSDGGVRIIATSNGKTSYAQYDSRMRPTTKRYSSGTRVDYEYFDNGQLKKMDKTDSDGVRQTVEFSANAQDVVVTDERKTKHEIKYDSSGRPIQLLINGRVRATYEYDELQRLEAIDYGSVAEHFQYDEHGRLVAYSAKPNEQVTSGTLQSVSYPANATGNGLWSSGQRQIDTLFVNKVSQSGESVFKRLDGRITAIHLQDATATLDYDRDGALYSIQIRKSQGMAEYLIENNRIVQVTDFDRGITQFHYDADGALVCVVDPYGNRTSYGYEERHRLTKIVESDGEQHRLSYDSGGRLTQVAN